MSGIREREKKERERKNEKENKEEIARYIMIMAVLLMLRQMIKPDELEKTAIAIEERALSGSVILVIVSRTRCVKDKATPSNKMNKLSASYCVYSLPNMQLYSRNPLMMFFLSSTPHA